MNDRRDLQVVLESGVPIVAIETADEARFLDLLTQIAVASPTTSYRPLFRWTVTDGLQRLDLDLEAQRHNSEPQEMLRHIRAVRKPGIYALLDFHPFLADPLNIRLLKDIAITARDAGISLLLISHELRIPPELESLSARFELRLPEASERRAIVQRIVEEYRRENLKHNIQIDPHAFDLLVNNMSGLVHSDVARLARNAIYDDGVIDAADVPALTAAKYQLLNRGGVLSFEYDVTNFAEVAGFRNVKVWLQQRRAAFSAKGQKGLDAPKGLLLIGVQGCGKSLAAKAAAGALQVPLLRLDFGALYDKYHGETEKNLRESLQLADTMSPCVLWLDEIEKGIASGRDESGTSRRVLASLLTWMSERKSRVLLVATANNVEELPPELVRKGRFDEIFFVDLPAPSHRAEIFSIHLRKRDLRPERFDLPQLVAVTEGYSGAEIEQGVVSALYAAHAVRQEAGSAHLLAELRKTRPLSVVMRERVAALRLWAQDRTVAAD